jgi:predicted tellurium resistance membrane protein TerC
MRLLRRVVPLSDEYDGDKLTTRDAEGRRLATPLLAALAMVAAFDVMFAIDSIPAIFAITRDTFIVFAAKTTNVSRVMAKIAGIESIANITSKTATMTRADAAGVAPGARRLSTRIANVRSGSTFSPP